MKRRDRAATRLLSAEPVSLDVDSTGLTDLVNRVIDDSYENSCTATFSDVTLYVGELISVRVSCGVEHDAKYALIRSVAVRCAATRFVVRNVYDCMFNDVPFGVWSAMYIYADM